MSYKNNTYPLKPEINLLVDQALEIGIDSFIYQNKTRLGELVNFVADQAQLRDGLNKKCPRLAQAGGFAYKRSLEQASSEITAELKTQLFPGIHNMLSLCSGLGIDDLAFARNGCHVTAIDANETLNTLFDYNAKQLGVTTVQRITDTAENYCLKQPNAHFDLIYLDPDRRSDEKRQILLSEHSPNVVEMQNYLLNLSSRILIKCSPMYDHAMAVKELKNIAHFYSISVGNEMKELLIEIQKDYVAAPQMTCIDIQKNKIQIKHFDDNTARYPLEKKIGAYFIETASCINKLRQQSNYAGSEAWFSILPIFGWFSSDNSPENAMGRVFHIIHDMPFNQKACKSYLNSKGIDKANVKTRGLKFNTQETYLKLKLKEGGEDYLFITEWEGKAHLIHAQY